MEIDARPWVAWKCDFCGNPAGLKVDSSELLACPICGRKTLRSTHKKTSQEAPGASQSHEPSVPCQYCGRPCHLGGKGRHESYCDWNPKNSKVGIYEDPIGG